MDANEDDGAAPPRRWVGWLKFLMRWGIAVIGITWIVSNLTIRDFVLVLDDNDIPQRAAVLAPTDGDLGDQPLRLEVIATGEERDAVRGQLVNGPDRDAVDFAGEPVELLGMRLVEGGKGASIVRQVLIRDPVDPTRGLWVLPSEVDVATGGYDLKVPQPLVEVGLRHLVADANPWLLAGGLLIFPVTFLATTYRWRRLVAAAGVPITYRRAFVLNVVGQFYSSFLPGNTGGDVIKAIYASRQTSDKTLKARAVVSVIVDRAIGLIALVILGGATAAYGYVWFGPGTPTADQCLQVALGSVAVLAVAGAISAAIVTPGLRRKLDIGRRLPKLPGIGHARNVVDALERYLRQPGLIIWATVISFPVHLTVAAAGAMGGMAFELPVEPGYYFVVVPVIVLAGSIPISPQGAGVMEFFAVTLLNRQGVTVAEAFALTMFIRSVHIFWNLVGGIFVLRGGFGNTVDNAEVEDRPVAAAT